MERVTQPTQPATIVADTCKDLTLFDYWLLYLAFYFFFYLLSKPTPVGVEALPLLVLVYVTDTVVGALWLLHDFNNVNFRCSILLTAAIFAASSPNIKITLCENLLRLILSLIRTL